MKLSLECSYHENNAKCVIRDGDSVVGKLDYTRSESPTSFKQSVSFQSSLGGLSSSDGFRHSRSNPYTESIASIESQLNHLKKKIEESFPTW